jgi:metal transporter CNNM
MGPSAAGATPGAPSESLLSRALEAEAAERARQVDAATGAAAPDASAAADFSDDEVSILNSVFSLQAKSAASLLEPRNRFDAVRMISSEEKMNYSTMRKLLEWGFSRVPVYRGTRRTNIAGFLLLKEQLLLDPDDATPVSSLHLRRPCVVPPSMSVFELLNLFQTGRSHLALVSPDFALFDFAWRAGVDVPESARIEGVLTIEDVLEELIGEEVYDETDPADAAGSPPGSAGTPALGPAAGQQQGVPEGSLAAQFSSSDPLLRGAAAQHQQSELLFESG